MRGLEWSWVQLYTQNHSFIVQCMHRHAFLQCMWNSLHSNMPFVQVYWWHDKYRPRKPKYFNRVHTGYEWNKYNQTHYDHDIPPPNVAQGYKLNIIYPDFLDKTKPSIYNIIMFLPLDTKANIPSLWLHAYKHTYTWLGTLTCILVIRKHIPPYSKEELSLVHVFTTHTHI